MKESKVWLISLIGTILLAVKFLIDLGDLIISHILNTSVYVGDEPYFVFILSIILYMSLIVGFSSLITWVYRREKYTQGILLTILFALLTIFLGGRLLVIFHVPHLIAGILGIIFDSRKIFQELYDELNNLEDQDSTL